jgi:hypothetical protein
VIGDRGPAQEGAGLASVQLDQLVGGFPHRVRSQQPQLGGREPVHPRGSRVFTVLEPPRQVLMALRMHRRDRGQVSNLGDRGTQDADVGRRSLITHRAEGVPQPVLVELDPV